MLIAHILCTEWYDFALFGFFSDVIADVFFPPSDTPSNCTGEFCDDNLLKSFAVYGGAFMMRPFGGMLIGYVSADRWPPPSLLISIPSY